MSDNEALVEQFAAAWDARDVDRAMELMTDDCWFHTSIGPSPGARYTGRAAVRSAFTAFLAPDPDPYVTTGPVATLMGAGFAVTRWSTGAGSGLWRSVESMPTTTSIESER